MGAINCRASAKMLEEHKSEADIGTPATEALHRAQSVVKSMTSRVLTSREELIQSAQRSLVSAGKKNFDSYYAFLLSQLRSSSCLSCTTDTSRSGTLHAVISVTSQRSGSRCGKENFLAKQYKRAACVSRPRTRTSRRPGLATTSNLYFYEETPTQGILSRGGKLKAMVPGNGKGGRKSRPSETPVPIKEERYQTCSNDESKQKSLLSETQASPKINFDIIGLLPWNVQTLILNFLISQYRRSLCVSAVWHSTLLSSLDVMFNPMENQLVSQVGQYFVFRNSYTQSTACKSGCWKGVRVDRVVQLELLPGWEGRTLTVAYNYRFVNDRKNTYQTQYRIDCVGRGSRTQWIHNAENVITGRKCTCTMNIVPICTADVVEFAVNYYTPRGLIETASIEWQTIEVENTPVDLALSRYNSATTGRGDIRRESCCKDVQEDLNRVCELEMTGSEWYDAKYYKMPEAFSDLREVAQSFVIESVEFASLDIKACKLRLTAYRAGTTSHALTTNRTYRKGCVRAGGVHKIRRGRVRHRGQAAGSHDRPLRRRSASGWRRAGAISLQASPGIMRMRLLNKLLTEFIPTLVERYNNNTPGNNLEFYSRYNSTGKKQQYADNGM